MAEFSEALRRASEHFKALGRRKIEIEEWAGDDGEPFVLYSKPLTLADKRKLSRGGGLDLNDPAVLADVCIMKCEDEAGNKVFKPADKMILMNGADAAIIAVIAIRIAASWTVEEAEGN